MSSERERRFVGHVHAIEELVRVAGKARPDIKEALEGHLNMALDALDAVQDLIGDVKDDAEQVAAGADAGHMPAVAGEE